jgi:hypothetical protein
MIMSVQQTLSRRICLICDECTSLLIREHQNHRREYLQWSKKPADRRRRIYGPREGDEATPFQENLIRAMEERSC